MTQTKLRLWFVIKKNIKIIFFFLFSLLAHANDTTWLKLDIFSVWVAVWVFVCTQNYANCKLWLNKFLINSFQNILLKLKFCWKSWFSYKFILIFSKLFLQISKLEVCFDDNHEELYFLSSIIYILPLERNDYK